MRTGASAIPPAHRSRSRLALASIRRFVVQRHAARRLHYDFRLERDGVLASWAVPKGIPMARGERHLAVHVEDHPLDYADFEGEILTVQCGAGTVEIWDRGTYELVEGKDDGGFTVRLHGLRLEGLWTLVPAALDGDPRNWLLLRKDAGVASRSYAPMLVVEIEFAEWTREGRLRAPVYVGLRDDKPAEDVVVERVRVPRRSVADRASYGSRTSRSRSGPTKESRRAICWRFTEILRRCSRRTSGTGRSR